jgi:very-short-patch-repair endonuclease
LRAELDRRRGQRGVPALRAILDRGTFVLTESELERRFVPIAARAGLGRPQTQRRVTGFKVDFFWPGPGLVAETNGLRYHRTAEQQLQDRRRVRFTHWQVRYDPDHVERRLRAVVGRLAG